jgi:hypothetical protein
MNERIRELAIKSGLVSEVWNNKLVSSFVEDTDVSEELNDFAELIVKECMEQIEEVRQIKAGHPTPDYEQGMNDGMFVAIRTIEEHFGVEE